MIANEPLDFAGSTVLVAPAKLTWFLEITGTRGDGWHDLRSEMVSLDLADSLEIVGGDETHVVHVPTGDSRLDEPIRPSDNLIARALDFVDRRATVRVTKRIPPGGGLGGGSSDAGAILRWAGATNVAAAITLGGDVPFCVHGGRALVEGLGERISDLPFQSRELTVVIPEFGVSTADCYRAFDQLQADGHRADGRNHLANAARLVEPRLATAMQWLQAACGSPVELCGSGSTMFLEGRLGSHDEPWTLESPVGALRVRPARTTARQPS